MRDRPQEQNRGKGGAQEGVGDLVREGVLKEDATHLRGFALCARYVEEHLGHLRRAVWCGDSAAGASAGVGRRMFGAVWLLAWVIVAALLVRLFPRLRVWRRCC